MPQLCHEWHSITWDPPQMHSFSVEWSGKAAAMGCLGCLGSLTHSTWQGARRMSWISPAGWKRVWGTRIWLQPGWEDVGWQISPPATPSPGSLTLAVPRGGSTVLCWGWGTAGDRLRHKLHFLLFHGTFQSNCLPLAAGNGHAGATTGPKTWSPGPLCKGGDERALHRTLSRMGSFDSGVLLSLPGKLQSPLRAGNFA